FLSMLVYTDSLVQLSCACSFYFFFQAEDGIRDWSVTGVQTCALPISEAATQLTQGGGAEKRTQRGRQQDHVAVLCFDAQHLAYIRRRQREHHEHHEYRQRHLVEGDKQDGRTTECLGTGLQVQHQLVERVARR